MDTLRGNSSEQFRPVDDLVLRANAGDKEALAALISMHRTSMRRTAFAILRNWDDTEDVVQDVSVILIKKLASFAGNAAFSTWLTRIVINTSLMKIRQQRRQRSVSLEEMQEGDLHYFPSTQCLRPTPEQQYGRQEFRDLLAEAVSRLPVTLRAVALDHIYRELPMSSVASRQGLSVAAAKSRSFRARKLLIHSLAREGFRKGLGGAN